MIVHNGPAKIGHVSTNYILSHIMSYLSAGIEYLHSVTYIRNTVCAENCIALGWWNKMI